MAGTLEQRLIIALHVAIGREREAMLADPFWEGDVQAAEQRARLALRLALDVVDPPRPEPSAEVDMVDVPIVQVGVIDAMRPYLREAFGGPDRDYRLHAVTPTGGSVTFRRGATADDVLAYWRREGWLPATP